MRDTGKAVIGCSSQTVSNAKLIMDVYIGAYKIVAPRGNRLVKKIDKYLKSNLLLERYV